MAKLPKAIIEKQRKAEELMKGQVEMAKTPVAVVEPPAVSHSEPVVETQPPVEQQASVESDQAPETGIPRGSVDDPKYKALQGKYNAEVPRLNAEAKQAKAEADELRKQLEEAKKINDDLKNSIPEGPVAWADQEDIDNYGSDYLEVSDKASKANIENLVNPQVEELKAELDNLRQGQEAQNEREAGNSERLLHERIAASIPNWVEMDHDKGWISWLNEFDPMYGDSRRYLLKMHYDNRNAEAVIAMFNNYFGEESGKPGMEVFSQPELRHGNPVSTEKRRFSVEEVKGYIADINGNRIKGKEASDLLREISEAQREGRIN